jgi:hypothetical protein
MRIVTTLGFVVVTGCAAGAANPARAPGASGEASSAAPLEQCAIKVEPAPRTESTPRQLAPDLFARSLAPVVDALCACAQVDEEARIDVRIIPAEGEVRASAPDEARLDACLAERLRPGRFTRFDPPAGTEGAVTSPAHLAAAHPDPVQKFRAKLHPGATTAPPPPPPVVLVYSLLLDRDRNALRAVGGAHAPAFEDSRP